MRRYFNLLSIISLVFISFLFGGCATILNNKNNTISTVSGKSSEVTILENGSVVYQGPLPTTINVNGSNNYTVQYKDKDGNSRTVQLQKKISGWFIADVLLIGGWIIDLITGDVMEYNKETILPISYKTQQQFLLVDSVPDHIQSKLTVISNIYK